MTEAEWHACADPIALLKFLLARYRRLSPRKLRLFAARCCRNVLQEDTHPDVRAAVRCLERHAEAATDELARMAQDLAQPSWLESFGSDCISSAVYATAQSCVASPYAAALDAAYLAAEAARWGAGTGTRETEQALHATWLRDMFPSPFRPKLIDPTWSAWNNATARTLAQQMDDREDYSAMPILADALQDAGCDDADVLGHCRDPHLTHVRGCWVVDLVLGRA